MDESTQRKYYKKIFRFLILCFSLLFIFSLVLFVNLNSLNRKMGHNVGKLVFEIEKELKHEVCDDEWRYLPKVLRGKAFADEEGMILSVKKLDINGVNAPYNPSIIEKNGGGYWLFFRYNDFIYSKDTEKRKLSYIGVQELDSLLNARGSVRIIDTGSLYSEDARAFRADGKLFLSYNDIMATPAFGRSIRVAELDEESFKLKYSSDLDLHINHLEKNWVPFVQKDENKKEEIFFIYQAIPHKIMHLKDPTYNSLNHLCFSGNPTFRTDLWPKELGIIRGGTPARLIDGEYLTFFHSCFLDPLTKVTWYVMGAYTFEAKPPYRITAISQVPILFKEMYGTPHAKKMNKMMRCVFPAGFATAQENDKEVIYLSIGENDSAIKLITIDKDKLYKSLRKINY